MPYIGEYYRHYKSSWGKDYTYEIIGIGKYSETGEQLVIYKSLYDTTCWLQWADYWVRPLSMRDEIVEYHWEKIQRFTKIS